MRLEELMRVLEQKIPWSEWKYLFKMATSKVVSAGAGPRVACAVAHVSEIGLAVTGSNMVVVVVVVVVGIV